MEEELYLVEKYSISGACEETIGEKNIDEIRSFGEQYIGKCFTDMADLERELYWLKEIGEDTWAINDYEYISIMKSPDPDDYEESNEKEEGDYYYNLQKDKEIDDD